MRPTPLQSACIILASTAFPALAAAQSSWTPYKFDAHAMAAGAEETMRHIKNGGVVAKLSLQFPYPPDPTGEAGGSAGINAFFWSDKKFQIEYLVQGSGKWNYEPMPEYLISMGTGPMIRRGTEVSQSKFDPKSPLFNVSSDEQLVEAWPTHSTKYLFSIFAHGNATFSRYVAALSKGVDGFQVTTYMRSIRSNLKSIPQYRIYASRAASSKHVAATVEIIFQDVKGDGKLFLPIQISTTYGKLTKKYGAAYKSTWHGSWFNMNPKNMPSKPDFIGPPGKVMRAGKPAKAPAKGGTKHH